MTHDLPMRAITDAEWPAYIKMITEAFHDDVRQNEADLEGETFEPERSLAVFDGTDPVATTGAYTRDLSVPGAVLPAAHVTLVAVLATHRRRGLLTRMMRQQLREVRDAGDEPIAVLWASEEAIYGRYGYGPASCHVSVDADTRQVRFPRHNGSPGRLRLAVPADAAKELAEVYERVRRHQPGFSSRPGPWWDHRLTDIERFRKGATARRCVLHEGPDGVSGYALWRSKQNWGNTGPNSEVQVEELVCTNAAGRAELWRFLFDLDLARRLSAWNLAADDPLFHLVDAPKRLARQLQNALYVRIVDLPAALSARQYATPLDLVLEVTDNLLRENAGRWRLVADPAAGVRASSAHRTDGADGGKQATCERTDSPADFAVDVRELGAAYLGGTSLGALAAAGLVTEARPGAVAAASAAFGWHVAPHAPEVF